MGRLELNQPAVLVGQANAYWYEIDVNGSNVYITTNSKYVHVVSQDSTPTATSSTSTPAQPAPTPTQAVHVGETFNLVNPTYLYYTPDAVVSGEKANLWDGLQVQVISVVNSDWMEVNVLNEGISGYITTSPSNVQPVSQTAAASPAPTAPSEPAWQVQADQVIATAKTQLGAPYYWGHQVPIGSVPAGQPYGFDCSNFTAWSYDTALGIRFSSSSEYQRYNVGTPVPLDQIREGDLLFFKTSHNSTGGGHVGLYMGNGMVIQCGGGWGKVTIESLATTWLGTNLVYARRVISS